MRFVIGFDSVGINRLVIILTRRVALHRAALYMIRPLYFELDTVFISVQ